MWSTHCEAHDGNGKMFSFYYPHEGAVLTETERRDIALLKELLAKVTDVRIPVEEQVNVSHGGYGRYSRYSIVQHKYAGGHGGYIEALEIKDAPDERKNAVIHEWHCGYGSTFIEFDSVANACAAWEKYWGHDCNSQNFPKCPGFIRRVPCGAIPPWFYAIGDQVLVGDYAFPHDIQQDSVFQFGRKFIVLKDGFPFIKTCMGCRFVKRDRRPSSWGSGEAPEKFYRIVYWHDGSCWEEGSHGSEPKPMQEGDAWIAEATTKFGSLLAGKQTHFVINFTNGTKFVGKVVPETGKKHCAQGKYFVRAQVAGVVKIKEGMVEFTPIPECPDVVTFVKREFESRGHVIESMEVESRQPDSKGKRWAGVFLKYD